MDSNGKIIQNDTPSILNIKPVEELDLPEKSIPSNPEEDYSDIEIEDVEKKDIFVKPETEQKKKKKAKKLISEKQKAHLKRMREKLRESQAKRRQDKGKPDPKPKSKHNIDDLYNKIEMLMSQYNKPISTISKTQPISKPNPQPQPQPISKPKPVMKTGTYSIDFKKSVVPYGNPFKF